MNNDNHEKIVKLCSKIVEVHNKKTQQPEEDNLIQKVWDFWEHGIPDWIYIGVIGLIIAALICAYIFGVKKEYEDNDEVKWDNIIATGLLVIFISFCSIGWHIIMAIISVISPAILFIGTLVYFARRFGLKKRRDNKIIKDIIE